MNTWNNSKKTPDDLSYPAFVKIKAYWCASDALLKYNKLFILFNDHWPDSFHRQQIVQT